MDEMFDAAGAALCCAAAIRLGGAMRVLAARAELSDGYDLVSAGVDNIVASLEGQDLDEDALGKAFGENWILDARYPAGLSGRAFFSKWTQLVFVTIVLTRPRQQQLVAVQGLDSALEAAAAWPSDVRVGSFTRLADYELACQQETEERLRKGGLPVLRKLAEEQSGQYRRAAELFVG
ncbi:hypothetical protein H1V43_18640 [Streptomyces sp. PSKA54]|uniref:Uncharacterized protein n=1 Tax=Streptomyces himalayensis subsp. aureolus TaxID=2758039 RepID=A0A7W2D275_9ACTN|nr:hypothetical protein [Streptomyces himalayensis]MBA4863363.1 hypothetical protein [Streptomyces himalayensis subsp. aureolus]